MASIGAWIILPRCMPSSSRASKRGFLYILAMLPLKPIGKVCQPSYCMTLRRRNERKLSFTRLYIFGSSIFSSRNGTNEARKVFGFG